ncbi:pyridoxal phosphate-dependent aminotransferase [Paratractidigestivibacter sp.]|uniref:pyridoxal phosphate-dependent aminotransferase n=1 Tax=Paratractidigestivibacter sp. TaxID=2847316 RepID=UPI002AC96401|nr:aminotransferase class I/II-fold pyridoxal phosphate-dependent enzyme [Paratractidigestivibacter sp.]
MTSTKNTNSDLALLATSGIRRFNTLANQTPGCVKLTLGEPEFDTPQAVKDAVARSLAAGKTHYPPNNGTPELLGPISAYMGRQGLDYAPAELIATCGATEALSATLMALLDPGDEVVVPSPAFGLYETIVRAAHGTVRFLHTGNNGFSINEGQLRSVVGERTKAIVITSPNNPTGCVYGADSLDAVANVAAEIGIHVICDDVYNRLCYTDAYERFAARHPELREQTVVVDSFSKPWAMTGWRIGWLAAAPEVKAQIEKMHQYLISSIPAFVQDAAAVALTCDVEPMRETYRRRRDLVVSRLGRMGLPLTVPEGAFYAFPDVSGLGMGSEELCERLVREAGVACVPGTCFGCEGFMRLSYCVADEALDLGLRRLESFLATL